MMNSKHTILVIDDEPQIRSILKIILESAQLKVIMAETGKEGVVMAATHQPDLILLDLGLPDIDGHTVLSEIRQWSNVCIIILSVRKGEEDIVPALNEGADDFLTKPFNSAELIARINAHLRRTGKTNDEPIFSNGNLKIDFVKRLVTVDGIEVKLTVKEYSVLTELAKNVGKVLTQRQLLKSVWGPSYTEQPQYLRVFVAQLRKKIETLSNKHSLIVTEPGVGYRMPDLHSEL